MKGDGNVVEHDDDVTVGRHPVKRKILFKIFPPFNLVDFMVLEALGVREIFNHTTIDVSPRLGNIYIYIKTGGLESKNKDDL